MLGEPAIGGRAGRADNRKVHRMLVLTRKSNQSIMIGDDVEVSVLRKEIYLEIHREDGTTEVAEAHEDAAEVNDALGDLGEKS
jgi:sRNA-binding carbon storage regulator CsrA